jgi:beta-lactam-binding protein with PASTA domain
MAENSDGPSTATIALVVLIATPVVLFVVFWLVGSGGSASAKATLPGVEGKGLQWAKAQTTSAGFDTIEAHDALGRDRKWRDDKDWMVCFQQPAAGSRPAGTKVELGVVKIEESCPASDQARYNKATTTMPELTNRTAYMTGQILGENASVRYLDRADGSEVSNGLGDWRVCSQVPKAGQPFGGVPVTTIVVRYEDRC